MAPNRSMRKISISLEDIEPHLNTVLFITGSFCVAWTWDLVAYGFSHASAGENPMKDQIGFGNQRAPKLLAVLLAEYLIVCGLVALLSDTVKHRYQDVKWCPAAIMAVEFLPAPFFSGKLMAYLGQFPDLTSLDQVFLNLLATAFAAFLAHAVQGSYDHPSVQQTLKLPPQLSRFPHILGDTLGFGLGVAWNVFLVELLGPDDMDYRHIIGLFGYLLVVLMVAFRLAAMVEDPGPAEGGDATPSSEPQQPSLIQRVLSLMSFAFNVVCAFTMVAFVSALLVENWIGDFLCLIILVLLASVMSAIVDAVNVYEETTPRTVAEQQQLLEEGGEERKYGFGTCICMDALVFLPCVWCCCPWIPLVWILAGITPDVTVKARWHKLIAFVLGLATSIQASGMFTKATNAFAEFLGICGVKYCDHRWVFVDLQVILAIGSTIILLPALGFVCPPPPGQQEEAERAAAAEGSRRGEKMPLLKKVRKMLPKFSRKSSSKISDSSRKSYAKTDSTKSFSKTESGKSGFDV